VPLTSRSRRTRGLAVVATVAALTLSACGGSGGSTSSSSSNDVGTPDATSAVDTLKIANGVAIDTLDPAENSANESIWIDQNLYGRLVRTDSTGTKIIPDLASSWDTSSDGLTYTFHLRDAKFSDGSAITAQDAVWSIERARALEDGWGFLITPVTSVTATDDKTVVIKLKTQHAPLLADLAMYAFSVLPQAKVTGDSKFFEHPVTSGAFTVSSYDPNSLVTLTANPNYFGTKPKIEKVEISVVTNDNTRVLQLQSKQVDVIENPPGNVLKQISANKDLRVGLFPSTRVDFMILPVKTKPLDNVKVRQAIKMALDLDEMNKLAYQGNAVPATTFFPYKSLYWDSSATATKTDTDGAKQLLTEAGYPDGFTIPLIAVSGDAAGQAQAVVVKDQLAKIGITVNIDSSDQSTAYAKERTGTNGMGMRYWTNDIIDPDEVATFGADSTGGANVFSSYWSDPATNALVEQARSETDASAREAAYKTVQQNISEQAPYIPLAYAPFRYATGAWVKGFSVSPLGSYLDSLLTLTVDQH
jgi:peptide/nickel transport system substrate-binding protein